MYSATVPHRCQDALVWKSDSGRKGSSAQGSKRQDYTSDCKRREVYYSMASGAMGSGHTACHRERRCTSGGLRAVTVETDAHRSTASATESYKEMERDIP